MQPGFSGLPIFIPGAISMQKQVKQAQSEVHCDYLVIGSGFGGSVAAMRLAEKGYQVVVLEQGKRWNAEDFPKCNWNLRRRSGRGIAGVCQRSHDP